MKHFIVSYFNLKIWNTDKHGGATRTDEWLRHRFGLFEQYCLPSLAAQTCRDFTWLCCLDADTPQEYRERMEQYRRRVPQIRPLYFTAEQARQLVAKDETDRCAHLIQAIREMVPAGEDAILTTNCDNDDALASDFVATLQRIAAHHSSRRTLISFRNGMQYFVAQQFLLRMRYPHNHFLSLVEPCGQEVHTVEWYGHTRAHKRLERVLDDNREPMWLEIVHDRNVNNALRITSRIRYSFIWHSCSLARFGIVKTLSAGKLALANLVRFPLYSIPVACSKLARKLRKSHD